MIIAKIEKILHTWNFQQSQNQVDEEIHFISTRFFYVFKGWERVSLHW